MDKDKKVIIKWIDSRQIHGWMLDGEIDDTCCSIESCGFLVRETEDAYTVALSKGYNPLQWCGINVIPKCCVVNVEEVAKEIFTDLYEPEVEKVISTIKKALEAKIEDLGNGVTKTACLAWLEKQGNSPIKWNKNTKDCKPKVNHSVLMKTTHGIAEGEWQGEQWHQYRWAGIVRDSDVLYWMELSDLDIGGE